MSPEEIALLRRDLGLSQVQFGELFGAHFMTVSKGSATSSGPPRIRPCFGQFRKTAMTKRPRPKSRLRSFS